MAALSANLFRSHPSIPIIITIKRHLFSLQPATQPTHAHAIATMQQCNFAWELFSVGGIVRIICVAYFFRLIFLRLSVFLLLLQQMQSRRPRFNISRLNIFNWVDVLRARAPWRIVLCSAGRTPCCACGENKNHHRRRYWKKNQSCIQLCGAHIFHRPSERKRWGFWTSETESKERRLEYMYWILANGRTMLWKLHTAIGSICKTGLTRTRN